jgi:anaerobic magnesium-protoporphyrin IX monomethyl ester cyclase
MRALLLCGLGPTFVNLNYLEGSLFTEPAGAKAQAMFAKAGVPDFALSDLAFEDGHRMTQLCRPRNLTMPHLTTFSLESILHVAERDYAKVDLAEVWEDKAATPSGDFDVALLSTTYIWNKPMLATAIQWVEQRMPGIQIVCGGQFTNLKFHQVLYDHPSVIGVVRGDGEHAIPAILNALETGASLATVPNLVWRDCHTIRINPIKYIDLEAWDSPRFPGRYPIVPYESMRGCPFDCKFCSFPAASPKWRYKSARKIRDDWLRYAQENEAEHISAMDSTFTIPPTRMRELLELLPSAGVSWEGFSRANTVVSSYFVEQLLAAHCHKLHIGFESMSDQVLKMMSKRVTSKQNRLAFHALRDNELDYIIFFMIGYPGETSEDFNETKDFLIEEYAGHFMLNFFSLSDETMPLWKDRDELRIKFADPDDPHSWWSHIGMNSDDARTLQMSALHEIREKNDDGVLVLWQHRYDPWFMPHRSRRDNLRVEKAVERLAMAPAVHEDIDRGAAEIRRQFERLNHMGVRARPIVG